MILWLCRVWRRLARGTPGRSGVFALTGPHEACLSEPQSRSRAAGNMTTFEQHRLEELWLRCLILSCARNHPIHRHCRRLRYTEAHPAPRIPRPAGSSPWSGQHTPRPRQEFWCSISAPAVCCIASASVKAARTLAAPGSTLKPLALYELITAGRWNPDRRVACNRKLVVAGHSLACTHPPAPHLRRPRGAHMVLQ